MESPGVAGLIRRILLALSLVFVGQVSQAAASSVQLAWDANSEPDLAGYVLVYGTAPGVYTQSVSLAATATTHEVSGLSDGTYYFAIRAFNAAGLQSAYSNEVAVVVGTGESVWPSIMTVSPTSGSIEGGTYVTITGTGFKPGVIVLFGGDEATVTAQSETSLTVFTPVGTPGPVAITLSNPESGDTVTKPEGFTYTTTTEPVSETGSSGAT